MKPGLEFGPILHRVLRQDRPSSSMRGVQIRLCFVKITELHLEPACLASSFMGS